MRCHIHLLAGFRKARFTPNVIKMQSTIDAIVSGLQGTTSLIEARGYTQRTLQQSFLAGGDRSPPSDDLTRYTLQLLLCLDTNASNSWLLSSKQAKTIIRAISLLESCDISEGELGTLLRVLSTAISHVSPAELTSDVLRDDNIVGLMSRALTGRHPSYLGLEAAYRLFDQIGGAIRLGSPPIPAELGGDLIQKLLQEVTPLLELITTRVGILHWLAYSISDDRRLALSFHAAGLPDLFVNGVRVLLESSSEICLNTPWPLPAEAPHWHDAMKHLGLLYFRAWAALANPDAQTEAITLLGREGLHVISMYITRYLRHMDVRYTPFREELVAHVLCFAKQAFISTPDMAQTSKLDVACESLDLAEEGLSNGVWILKPYAAIHTGGEPSWDQQTYHDRPRRPLRFHCCRLYTPLP